jgi:hypothetical protein
MGDYFIMTKEPLPTHLSPRPSFSSKVIVDTRITLSSTLIELQSPYIKFV